MTATRASLVWAVGAGLLGFGLVMTATSTSGPGVSPDAAAYLSAAESLAAGRGLVKFDGTVYAWWPPLFPAAIAAGVASGAEPLAAARVVNALAFAWIVVAAQVLLRRSVRSPWSVAVGTAATLLSVPLLTVSIMAWSEPVFTALLVTLTVWLRRWELDGRPRDLLAAAGFAALACLQRYAGVLAVGGAVLVLLLGGARRPKLLDRLAPAVVFAAVALAPVAAWVVRNTLLTDSTMLPIAAARLTAGELLRAAGDVLTSWLLPRRWPLSARIAVVAALAAGAVNAARTAGAGGTTDWKARLRTPAVLAAVYAGLVLVVTHHDEVARLLSPLYVWVTVVVLIAVEELITRLRAVPRRAPRVVAAATAVAIVWLGYQGSRVVRDVSVYLARGAAGERWDWADSPTLRWVRTTAGEGILYSNAPELIYLIAGKPARASVTSDGDLSPLAGPAPAAPRLLVWLALPRPAPFIAPESLARRVSLDEVIRLPDGVVYRVGDVAPR